MRMKFFDPERLLEKLHIPCRLETSPEGGHGFADGTSACVAGWTEQAVRWHDGLEQSEQDEESYCAMENRRWKSPAPIEKRSRNTWT